MERQLTEPRLILRDRHRDLILYGELIINPVPHGPWYKLGQERELMTRYKRRSTSPILSICEPPWHVKCTELMSSEVISSKLK